MNKQERIRQLKARIKEREDLLDEYRKRQRRDEQELATLLSGCEPGTIIKTTGNGGWIKAGTRLVVTAVKPHFMGFELETVKFKKDGTPSKVSSGAYLTNREIYKIVGRWEGEMP